LSAVPWRVGNAHPKPLCSVMKSGDSAHSIGWNTAQFHYAFGRRDRLRPSYYTFRTYQNGAVAPSCGQQVLANIAIRLGELFSGTTILSNQNRSNRPAYIYLVVKELSTKGRHDLLVGHLLRRIDTNTVGDTMYRGRCYGIAGLAVRKTTARCSANHR
jgi:hypothetical protein